MISAEKIAKLRLLRSENVGVVTFRTLLNHFGSAIEAIDHLPEFARRSGRNRPLRICSEQDAKLEIDRLYNAGGKLVFQGDADFPDLLAMIPDAPPFFSALGNTKHLKQKSVAIVGTRNATINGKNFARKMAADLVKEKYAVISGLALGIDAAAHEGALMAANDNVSTIAVLGTGLNIPYPDQNRRLYDEIREKGVIISEYALDTKPQPQNFPLRNRIISGISCGLVVIEAALRSGSLITANKALEQGKDVFAVPASPLDPRAAGVNHLIKTGAPLVESAADIIGHLTGIPMLTLTEYDTFIPETKKKSIDIEQAITPAIRADLLDKLDGTPIEIDVLIRETGLPANVISVLLVELELAGQIERLAGNKVIRISTAIGQ